MKSYVTDTDNNKEFLNSFKFDKERNLLILEYASGDIIPANCTRENMKMILNKMKRQVLNSKDFESKISKKFYVSLFMSSLAGLMIILLIFLPNLPIILLFTSIITLYIASKNMLESYNMLRDIRKNRLFLKYSNEINDVVKSLSLENINKLDINLEDVVIKDENPLYMGIKDIPIINLNSTHNNSLNEVENLIKTLKIKPKK